MAGRSRSGDRDENVTVSFGAKFARSDQFKTVFREGMALVEAAATYLDGDGRKEARKLRPPHSLAYATESMRLTTRLMQLASWLLIRRAVSEGELTPRAGHRGAAQDQASGRRRRSTDARSWPVAAPFARADRAERQAPGARDAPRSHARFEGAAAPERCRQSARDADVALARRVRVAGIALPRLVIARLDRAIQQPLPSSSSEAGSNWIPAFAGMVSRKVI